MSSSEDLKGITKGQRWAFFRDRFLLAFWPSLGANVGRLAFWVPFVWFLAHTIKEYKH